MYLYITLLCTNSLVRTFHNVELMFISPTTIYHLVLQSLKIAYVTIACIFIAYVAFL
jgi:hypothetical protein